VIILLLIPDRILHANLFLFVVLFVQFPDRVSCGKLSSLSISFERTLSLCEHHVVLYHVIDTATSQSVQKSSLHAHTNNIRAPYAYKSAEHFVNSVNV